MTASAKLKLDSDLPVIELTMDDMVKVVLWKSEMVATKERSLEIADFMLSNLAKKHRHDIADQIRKQANGG